MEKYNQIIIKPADEEGKELHLTIPADCGIYDWLRVFRHALKWLTFNEGIIEQAIPEQEIE